MHLSTKLLAAAVAVSVAGIANAKKFDVDLNTPFEELVVHKSTKTDSFVDKFSFDLSNEATLSVNIEELFNFNTKLSLLDVDLFKIGGVGTSLVFDSPVLTDSDPSMAASFSTGILDASSYSKNKLIFFILLLHDNGIFRTLCQYETLRCPVVMPANYCDGRRIQ